MRFLHLCYKEHDSLQLLHRFDVAVDLHRGDERRVAGHDADGEHRRVRARRGGLEGDRNVRRRDVRGRLPGTRRHLDGRAQRRAAAGRHLRPAGVQGHRARPRVRRRCRSVLRSVSVFSPRKITTAQNSSLSLSHPFSIPFISL